MRRPNDLWLRRGSTLALVLVLGVALSQVGAGASDMAGARNASAGGGTNDRCHDPSDDPAGCQPSTLDTPIGDIPGGRVDASGRLDPFASAEDAIKGAFKVEQREGLFRNFEHLHWVPTVPSERDPETGEWDNGDLEADGDARGIGVTGNCIFVGHSNGGLHDSSDGSQAGQDNDVNIFRIQPNPEKDPPVQVGTIPSFPVDDPESDAIIAADDREVRGLSYTSTDGVDRMLMVRNSSEGQDGNLTTYDIDPDTCLPIGQSSSLPYPFGGQLHEFYLWHDPNNPNRVLVFTQMWSGGEQPDPYNEGHLIPDLIVMAITDENTGEVLEEPVRLAGFTLQDVGGPLHVGRPDETGLYADGRFPDYSHLTDSWGRSGSRQTSQWNRLHNASVSDDGERIYVAHGTAGFYILNSEAIPHHTNAELAAGNVGCNKLSTNAWIDGVADGNNDGIVDGMLDVDKLPQLADDCIRMVINDDPGVKALLASDLSDTEKLLRYQRLLDNSRLDLEPSGTPAFTGFHSAVPIPNRPSLAKGNTEERPAFLWLSDENGRCPLQYSRMVSIESEVTPIMIGAFAIPDNKLEECLTQETTEPDGTPKERRVAQQNHNPTTFENIVFIGWYGHGLRAVDISIPYTPREVGHAITVPWGNMRSYPIFNDGLIYWTDNSTGLHVAKYTGPRADEIPTEGVYEGNATSPHG